MIGYMKKILHPSFKCQILDKRREEEINKDIFQIEKSSV